MQNKPGSIRRGKKVQKCPAKKKKKKEISDLNDEMNTVQQVHFDNISKVPSYRLRVGCSLVTVTVTVLVAITAVLQGRTGRRTNVRRVALDVGIRDGLAGTLANMGGGVGVDIALGAATILVDLERVDAPVGLCKCRRIVLHIRFASVTLGCAGAGRPSLASPVTTESNVEDDLKIVEVRVNVTVSSEFGCWSSPGRWVRATTGDVGGNTGVREEPNTDGVAGPLSGIDAATMLVEPVSVRGRASARDSTSSILRLAGSLDVAVASLDVTAKAGIIDRATRTGVQSHLVGGLVVNTLDDVNFAVVRPIGTDHPERRPGTANTAGHVVQIQDHQTMGIGIGAFQAHTRSARVAGSVYGIDANINGVVSSLDETTAFSSRSVNIVDIPIGGVRVREEIELVKE